MLVCQDLHNRVQTADVIYIMIKIIFNKAQSNID